MTLKKILIITLSLVLIVVAGLVIKRHGHKYLFQYTDVGVDLLDYLETNKPLPTDQNQTQALYQTLKDAHDAFEVTGVRYWVCCGTLLGLVRHGGIIPWDIDADIAIHEEDEEKFLKIVVPVMKKLGYSYGAKPYHKFYPENIKHSKTGESLDAHMDIFLVTKKGDQYVDVWHDWVAHKDLYPLKKRPFLTFDVNTPNYPDAYLTDSFGKNWSKLAYHEGKSYKLKDTDKVPASLIAPLTDNRAKIEAIYKELFPNGHQ